LDDGTHRPYYTPNADEWADQVGLYRFEGVVTIADANINTTALPATLYVIVNDVPYAISLDTDGTHVFPSEHYGYTTAPAAHMITIRNLGTFLSGTGALHAQLSGTGAGAFALSGSTITNIDKGDTDMSLSVQPNLNLTPGTYTATLTVGRDSGLSDTLVPKSYDLSFTVLPDEITGFDAITPVPAGVAGYDAPDLATLQAQLLSSHSTVGATTTNGTTSVPVSAWVPVDSYDPMAPGSYVFKANLGAIPSSYANPNALTAYVAVTIEQPVNAAAPVFGPPTPSSHDGVIGKDVTIEAEATAPDGGVISYQWYSNAANNYIGGAAIPGEINTQFDPPVDAEGAMYYWCEAINHNAAATGVRLATANSIIVAVRLRYAELTVVGGAASAGTYSGESGKYIFGESVIITATPVSGKRFTGWTVTSGSATLTDATADSTTLTMPAGDVTVTANFAGIYIDIPSLVTPTPPPDTNTDTGSDTDAPAPTPDRNDTVPDSDTGLPFIDVKVNDWFYTDAAFVYTSGLIRGTDPVTFAPELPMTRAMLVTVLFRREQQAQQAQQDGNPNGNPNGSPSPGMLALFDDVPTNEWYSDAIVWASSSGIITGVGENKFAPEEDITREQLAVLLYRYEQLTGSIPPYTTPSIGFADSDVIGDYARVAVDALTRQGIIKGKPGNLFDPKATATRAEVATLLHRFIQATKPY
ncbi:MAG: S-layer homology domain-containing protein, partial [Oscillospiraceae bacterium]|jgi:uncharacterized repeat protein (TIGR02543 family)|nr:S-layer homology domain-containing protein [Oscillospiraceae bacterium]